MKKTYDEYKAMLLIDVDNLDRELIEGAHVMQEIVEESIRTALEKEAANSNIKNAKGDLDMQIRTNPARFGIDTGRLTDARVAAAVESHQSYLDAVKAYETAKKVSDEWAGLVHSWERKASNQRIIADLYMTNFFVPNSNSPNAGKGSPNSEDIKKRREMLSANRRQLLRPDV